MIQVVLSVAWFFFWCQTCGSEYFRNCRSSGIFRHSRLPFVQSGLKTGGYVVGSGSLGQKYLVDVSGQRRKDKLKAPVSREATVTRYYR